MTDTDTQLFEDLFIHRRDVLAEQSPTGAYYPVECESPTELDLMVEEHLEGFRTLGSYVLKPDDPTCRFAMIDIDTGDEEDLNQVYDNLRDGSGLQYAEILVETSGQKGWHVWVFFSEPHPFARDVRYWLRTVAAGHELFPKQDKVGAGAYGNLVKLPLGLHQKSHKWSTIEANLDEIELVDQDRVPTAPVSAHKAAGGKGKARTGFPCTDAIMAGEVPSGGRHNALVHAGLVWRKYGLTWEECEAPLRRLNDSFSDPVSDGELEGTVLYAEPNESLGPVCRTEWCGTLCDKDKCFLTKKQGFGPPLVNDNKFNKLLAVLGKGNK